MTSGGGLYNLGAIFKMNSDGSGFKKLFDFDGKTQWITSLWFIDSCR